MGTSAVAEDLGVEPLGRIVASRTVAVEPDRFSIAPVPAIEQALERAGMRVSDVDLWEINEAFAAMVLSTLHHLPQIDPDGVNANGGAIAIGHPLGRPPRGWSSTSAASCAGAAAVSGWPRPASASVWDRPSSSRSADRDRRPGRTARPPTTRPPTGPDGFPHPP